TAAILAGRLGIRILDATGISTRWRWAAATPCSSGLGAAVGKHKLEVVGRCSHTGTDRREDDQVRSADWGCQRRATARRCDTTCRYWPRADAGFRQGEFDSPCSLPVARQRRDNRAGLLVAGQQQKRRRAPVTLHADHIEVRLWMRQLVRAVRRDG